jgi:hypothetical protein
MIVIRIYGFDQNGKAYIFNEIKEGIKEEIHNIGNLKIDEKNIEVFFPKENWTEGLRERIIIFVSLADDMGEKPLIFTSFLKEEIKKTISVLIKTLFPKSPVVIFTDYFSSDNIMIS